MPKKNGYSHHGKIRGGEEAWSKTHPDGTFTMVGYEKAKGSNHYTLFVTRVPNTYRNVLRGITPLVKLEVEDFRTLEPQSSIEDAREVLMEWIENNPEGLEL